MAACSDDPVVRHLPIPPERIDCVAYSAADRPTLPAEYRVDWQRVESVDQAQAEHQKFVDSVRAREGLIAVYIVEVEGELWACASDDEWLRDWQAAVEE